MRGLGAGRRWTGRSGQGRGAEKSERRRWRRREEEKMQDTDRWRWRDSEGNRRQRRGGRGARDWGSRVVQRSERGRWRWRPARHTGQTQEETQEDRVRRLFLLQGPWAKSLGWARETNPRALNGGVGIQSLVHLEMQKECHEQRGQESKETENPKPVLDPTPLPNGRGWVRTPGLGEEARLGPSV